MAIDENHRHGQTRVILAQLANKGMSLREQAEYLRSQDCDFCLKIGARQEQERIINLMNSHRVVFSLDSFEPVLSCNKCGNVTNDQPSHLMRLIKGNENG